MSASNSHFVTVLVPVLLMLSSQGLLLSPFAEAWVVVPHRVHWLPLRHQSFYSSSSSSSRLNIVARRTRFTLDATDNDTSESESIGGSREIIRTKTDDDDAVRRISFDQAGASLIEEEDRQRLEEMGDFDSNPAYQQESIEKMREAIRSRTAAIGIEKSKVTADYIKAKEKAALEAGGPPGAMKSDTNSFGGLDLSQISYDKGSRGGSTSQWDESMPTMLYDPDEELSDEEQEQVDPLMKKSFLEQAQHELSNATWPTPGAVLREVGLLLVVGAIAVALILGYDRLVRYAFTEIGWIPTKEDLANYASRFDSLDLPKGWMNNMSEQDVARFAETVNENSPLVLPDISSISRGADVTLSASDSLFPSLPNLEDSNAFGTVGGGVSPTADVIVETSIPDLSIPAVLDAAPELRGSGEAP